MQTLEDAVRVCDNCPQASPDGFCLACGCPRLGRLVVGTCPEARFGLDPTPLPNSLLASCRAASEFIAYQRRSVARAGRFGALLLKVLGGPAIFAMLLSRCYE